MGKLFLPRGVNEASVMTETTESLEWLVWGDQRERAKIDRRLKVLDKETA